MAGRRSRTTSRPGTPPRPQSTSLAHVDAFFRQRPDAFAWQPPRAGTVAFPRLTLPVPAEEFVSDLAREESVLLLPDSVFDTDDNRFRIGLGRTSLPLALDRLDTFLTRRAAG
ncbi:hypothetical protein ACWEKM_00685 [Streptomyces sp. NPDC004752]